MLGVEASQEASMELSEKAAQSAARDHDEVMRRAYEHAVHFNLAWIRMACNPLSYVPDFLLPKEIRPPPVLGGE